jgi:DNA modification methylase
MALQDDGWICRAEIIWYKGPGGGRPESVTNRVTKNHEKIFMFTKRRQYFYDPDPIREPSAVESTNRAFQAYQNPMGRNSGSVWEITPSSYRGDHPATMPLELVRRMLLVSCPDKGTVMDVFGGAGTTALVALQLGYRAISIEINEPYTKEAQQRIAFQIGASTPNKMAAD